MAIETTQERHRPGSLKQQNKVHKHGRHKSKGSLDTLKKGKTAIKAISQKAKRELKKNERRNQVNQLRHKKREDYLQAKRGLTDAPFLIALVPLNAIVKTSFVINLFKNADVDAVTSYSSEAHLHIGVGRFRQRFTLVECDSGQVLDVLDTLKVVDAVVWLVPAGGLDEGGELVLAAAIAQGLPSSTTAVLGLPLKKQQETKARLQKAIQRWLPDKRVVTLEREGDALALLRRVGCQKMRRMTQRDRRPHLLAERVEFVPDPGQEREAGVGTVKLTGYLRGQTLSVNSLVHVPGWGDFQLRQIDCEVDPHCVGSARSGPSERRTLEVADPTKQESLDRENIPDPMDAEQTWPTEAELAEADGEGKRVRLAKRVPAGMSDYQAAWIPDCDAEEIEDEYDDDEEDADGMECEEDDSEGEGEEGSDEGEDAMTVTSEAPVAADKYDQEVNHMEEQETLRKIREARLEQMFPDEVDTPIDTPARVRFQKYRGLKSFRTSPWDTKENLPSDYARIFQFQNFDRTKKRVLKEQEDLFGASPGWYITVYVAGVRASQFAARLGSQPLVMVGLLPHEQKMSVTNMVLRRPALLRSDEPLKSKEPLVFQCGYRRFRASPIFSQHTNGAKHKYERYFQPDAMVVASVYAPVMFPPASVLAFKEMKDGSQVLVGTGSLLSVSPDRVVLKRVVLSGHPCKVNKRSAVIRFMFFNREDIEWFKPVELRTRLGRRGHIKEPLGTHGHMKCVFDTQLKSQDTVMLHLYKRVFPKWTFSDDVQPNASLSEDPTMDTC